MKKQLTNEEKSFVDLFMTNRDMFNSYRKSFDCDGLSDDMVSMRIRETLSREPVRNYFNKIRALFDANLLFDKNDVMYEWLELYLADVNEIVSVNNGSCRYCHGRDHQYQWTQNEYLQACQDVTAFNEKMTDERLRKQMPDISGGLGYNKTLAPHPNCPECNGIGVTYSIVKDTEKLSTRAKRLYRGVKQTKYGPEVIIADKDKALENVAKALSMFQEKFVVVSPNDGLPEDATITKENAIDIYQQLASIGNKTAH